jgi:aspartyl protease family protein
MPLSSASQQALRLAASWLGAAAIGLGTFLYFDELKGGVSFALGLPPVGEASQRHEAVLSHSDQRSSGSTVEIRAGRNGHYMTTAHVNGRAIDVLVDTGASVVALTYEDAERAGIYVRASDFTHRVRTANGIAKAAPVVLSRVSIGDITVRDVQASVSEPGRLGTTLLGMTFLSRLQRADMRNGVLLLQE